MKKVYQIDSNGLYVSDVILNDNAAIPSNCIGVDPPVGLHILKWNGTQWVEGSSDTDLLNLAKQQKTNDLRSGYAQTLASGFNVTLGTTTYVLGWSTDDKANLDACQTAIERSYQTFPINYADIHGNPITLSSQTDLDVIEQTASKFAFAQHQQIMNLVSQTQNATDVTAVNTIQWTPATY